MALPVKFYREFKPHADTGIVEELIMDLQFPVTIEQP